MSSDADDRSSLLGKASTGAGAGAGAALAPSPAPAEQQIIHHRQTAFKGGACRDGIWAALFIGHLITFIGIGIGLLASHQQEIQNDSDVKINKDTLLLAAFVLLLAIALSVAYLIVVRKYPRELIWVTLVLGVIMIAAGLVVAIIMANLPLTICMAILLVLEFVYIWAVQDSIDFSAMILEISVKCVQLYPATMVTAIVGVIAQAVWLLVWIICSAAILYSVNKNGTENKDSGSNSNSNSSASGGIIFVLFIVFYWTSQVIKNVVHVTIAGVVGAWYFLSPHHVHRNPTWNAYKRAMTTSFGSICLGSLIMAVVKAIRSFFNYIVEKARSDGETSLAVECLICVAKCILAIIDQIVEFINMFAFAQVAIYGKTYCEAASDTWQLMKRRGLDAVVNDSLIGGVLAFGALIGGIICALFAALVARYYFNSADWVAWCLIAGVIGFAMTMVVLEVVYSAVVTLFVCLAEDPVVLYQTKPEDYNRLVPQIEARYNEVHLESEERGRGYTTNNRYMHV